MSLCTRICATPPPNWFYWYFRLNGAAGRRVLAVAGRLPSTSTAWEVPWNGLMQTPAGEKRPSSARARGGRSRAARPTRSSAIEPEKPHPGHRARRPGAKPRRALVAGIPRHPSARLPTLLSSGPRNLPGPGGRLIATHMSHSGNPTHEKVEAILGPHGVEVAYDGLEIVL